MAYLAWSGLQALTRPDFATPFSGVNFGVHELGHLVFAPFGEWTTVAGGTVAQLLLPLAAAALFVRQRDRYAVCVCVMWLAISLADVATYADDARALQLDLVSLSEDGSGHDWTYLLDSVGMLNADVGIARAMRIVAVLLLGGGLVMGVMESVRPAGPTPGAPAD